jgi:hypothetical protein
MNKSFHLFNVQKQIEDNFSLLMKSGKISLNLTLEESIERRNIEINDEHDEDILEMKRDEYYKDYIYNCRICKQPKSRKEFFHTQKNTSGIGSTCKQCYKDEKDKG